MGLEFIDISREEGERARANGTTGGRRAPGKGEPRPVRQNDSRTIKYKNQRGQRYEGQRQVSVQPQRARQPRPTGYSRGDNQRENAVRRPRPVDPRAQRERMRRQKIRRQKAIAARMIVLLVLLLVIVLAGFLLYKFIADFIKGKEPAQTFNSYTPTVERREVIKANETNKPVITEDFLTVNEYSRPGEALGKVKNIFVHYTANPGTSAAQNRSYFENLGITGETSASAHFVIGYEGEIIQCIPLDEIAYAVMQRNYDSISIECCYLSEDGKFTDATYQSLLKLSAWLLKEYKLAPDDMRRHYDEGGKKCPLYYVEHEEAWEKFLSDLEQYIMNNQV